MPQKRSIYLSFRLHFRVKLGQMSLLKVAQEIEASHIGTAIRESMWAFPLLNLAHLLGLMVAAGTIIYWDLRLLGFGLRRSPVSEVGSQLLPWTWGGFSVMAISGILRPGARPAACTVISSSG